MKSTRRQGTEKKNSLWENLTSGILDKVTKTKELKSGKNCDRDMGEAHTPISRLDLTGLNREQAKELINRIIDEKLEMISHIEMTELKIDYKERERQRAKAAERINERRNRRKQKSAMEPETIVTEQGVYSNFKQESVFDVIQPEEFPFEEYPATPIEGQLSILDALAAADQAGKAASAEYAPSIDIDHISGGPHGPSEEDQTGAEPMNYIEKSVKAEQTAEAEMITVENEQAAEAEKIPAEKELVPEVEILKNHIPYSFDIFRMVEEEEFNAGQDTPKSEQAQEPEREEAQPEKQTGRISFLGGISINTSLDAALDKVFASYSKGKTKILLLGQRMKNGTSQVLKKKVLPVMTAGCRKLGSVLVPLAQKAETKLKLKAGMTVLLAFISGRERIAADRMAGFINFIDRKNDALLYRIAAIGNAVHRGSSRVREYAENNKKKILVGFSAGVAVAAAVTITIGSMTAYEYIYNGKVLGVVKNQEDVYKTIDIIGDKLSAQYDAEISIDKDKDIRFNKVIAFSQELDDKDDILNRLTYMRDMKANGQGIYVDGKLMAVLESKETAKEILNQLQNTFVKKEEGVEYTKIGFAEDVEIKDVETKLGKIEAKDKVLEYMMTGAVEKKIHVVQSGETFSEIAKMYGLKQSELKVSNPDVVPEKLHIGQEICLNQIVPLVTVQTTEIAQYREAIPFEIQYENTSSLFKNEQTVKSRGTNGEKDVVAEIVRNNGIEVSRKEISATILSEPVSQVVLVGTKEPPPLIGTGTFIYPIRGTLTSRFGTRWGRLHSGIDLAAPIGTHIKAADGGKVTFSGYNGALGYMVAIDHGGGRVTWYGHCSKLFVKKGERVYQGQHIANVGNTGRSTGPHVHFEVHINGKAKNPLNYL